MSGCPDYAGISEYGGPCWTCQGQAERCPDMPDHLTDAEQWALDELADLSIDYPAVVQAAADRLIPTATVRPEARARFLAAADRALAVRRADLGPLPIVLAAVRKRAGISVDAIQDTYGLDGDA